MKITNKQLALVLQSLCAGIQKGNELQQRIEIFVKYLGQNSLIHRAPAIEDALKELELKDEGKEKVTVESPFELKDETVEAILKKLNIEKPVVTQKKNKKLIGGLIAKTEDTIYDISLKTQLSKLQQKMAD